MSKLLFKSIIMGNSKRSHRVNHLPHKPKDPFLLKRLIFITFKLFVYMCVWVCASEPQRSWRSEEGIPFLSNGSSIFCLANTVLEIIISPDQLVNARMTARYRHAWLSIRCFCYGFCQTVSCSSGWLQTFYVP